MHPLGMKQFLHTCLKLIVSEILVRFAKDMLYPHNKWDARFLAISHVMLTYGACTGLYMKLLVFLT